MLNDPDTSIHNLKFKTDNSPLPQTLAPKPFSPLRVSAVDSLIIAFQVKNLYPSHEFIQDPEQDGYGIGAIEYSSQVALPEVLKG